MARKIYQLKPYLYAVLKTWKGKMAFVQFVLFGSCPLLLYIISGGKGGLSGRVPRLKSETGIDWTFVNDAWPSCSELNMDSEVQSYSRSCRTLETIEYDALMNAFIVNRDALLSETMSCPREVARAGFHLPSTRLLSWPGSGNTWTRHLIQQLTGIESGSLYFDRELKRNGFPGEGKITNVIVVKSHEKDLLSGIGFTKQIFLMRNPFYALVAEYRRSRLKGSHSGRREITPDNQWKMYAVRRTKRWMRFVRASLTLPNSHLLLLYEDMTACLVRELLRLSVFLSTTNQTRFSICCALANSVGSYYRNQGGEPISTLYSGYLKWFVNEQLSILAAEIAPGFLNWHGDF